MTPTKMSLTDTRCRQATKMSGTPRQKCRLPPDKNVAQNNTRIIIQVITYTRASVAGKIATPAEICATPAEICATPAENCGGPPQKNAQTPRKKMRVDYYKIILIQERLTRAPARVYKAHLKGTLTMYRPFYNLRVRFAQCEMSQNEVARAAGMASSTMTARMTGAQPFDAWQIEKIAQTLSIPPEEYYKYFFDHKKAV